MNAEEIFLNTPIYSSSSIDGLVDYVGDLEVLKDALKDVLRSEQTAQHIFNIIKNHQLQDHQGPVLAGLVRDIIMGYVFLADMTTEIEKRLQVDEQVSGEIGDQILGEIFAPVWKELEEWNVRQYAIYSKQNMTKIMNPDTQGPFMQPPPSTPPPAIATGLSFRDPNNRATIKTGYNPKAQRLQPFMTSAAQAKLTNIQKQSPVIRPQQNRKILDLRKKPYTE